MNISNRIKFKQMKQILCFFIACAICLFVQGQNLKIRSSPVLSPKKDKLVFLIDSDSNIDIYIYSFTEDTIIRATNSTGLIYGYQYKDFLNWVDNERILFISKQDGIARQWILDLSKNALEQNGHSPSNEYFLTYSPQTGESFYISSLKGKEPAVYRRKLYSETCQTISKNNVNHIDTQLSPKSTYLSFKEMPLGTLFIYSLAENKYLKTTLPKKNISILSWNPNENKFIYSYGNFPNNNNPPKHSIFEYDIDSQKSTLLFDDLDFVYRMIWAPCETKYLYSSLDKLYIKDIISNETQIFDIIGRPICWIDDCASILFETDKQLFIYNIDTREIKMIIDLK